MAEATRSVSHYKVVLVGNSGVGKSCLVLRFAEDQFTEDIEATIGAAFWTKAITLEDRTVKLELWDTAGQERYRALAPMYYRGAAAAVVVYSVTSYPSYEGAKKWIAELNNKAHPNTIIALCGNKLDKVKGGGSEKAAREVDKEEVIEFCKTHNLLFIETSAKTGENVVQLFTDIARALPTQSGKTEREPWPVSDTPPKKGCCG